MWDQIVRENYDNIFCLQINYITKSVWKCCKRYKTKKTLPSNIKYTIYNSLFQPHIELGITVWGNSNSNEIKRICSLQNMVKGIFRMLILILTLTQRSKNSIYWNFMTSSNLTKQCLCTNTLWPVISLCYFIRVYYISILWAKSKRLFKNSPPSLTCH